MDSTSALAHLDSVVRPTKGLTIEAWPAKSDDDTSEDFLTLVGVDSPLGFTVVVIEPVGTNDMSTTKQGDTGTTLVMR